MANAGNQVGFDGSAELQEIIDSIQCYDELLNLNLSITIADPLKQDCPLIACSEGFTELTGYTVQEIVGRNCRFLLNGVPEEFLDDETRFKCRDFVNNCRGSPEESLANLTDKNLSEFLKRKPWATLTQGELICVQTNATKSGELFRNMFYLKQVELNEKPFILGLQARLPEEWETTVDSEALERYCQQAFASLGKNLGAVELVLSKQFWYSAAARRQDGVKTVLPMSVGPGAVLLLGVGAVLLQRQDPMGALGDLLSPQQPAGDDFGKNLIRTQTARTSIPEETIWTNYVDIDLDEVESATMDGDVVPGYKLRAPLELHTAFDQASVQEWPPQRFEIVRKIEDANRNQGCVCLMRDLAQGRFVATKQMPNSWVRESHAAFNSAHPHETEQPWNDIGCNAFLNSIGYPYCVSLLGVYRDQVQTSVVSEFAAGGDLFSWASKLQQGPSPAREAVVRPLAKQIAHGIQYLHELSIVHGDLSIENILLTTGTDENLQQIKLIDFGAASTVRHARGIVTGKPSYQAPEMFEDGEHDAFLSDAFSFGVVVYATCLMDYPWITTQGKGDKCFQYVKSKGFCAFAKKRKLPNSRTTLEEVLSLELCQVLEGLLQPDPAKRLTLGESTYVEAGRCRSVWEEQWMQ